MTSVLFFRAAGMAGRTPSVECRKLLTNGRPAFLSASSNDICYFYDK